MSYLLGVPDVEQFWDIIEMVIADHVKVELTAMTAECNCGWAFTYEAEHVQHVREEMVKMTAPLWRIVETDK